MRILRHWLYLVIYDRPYLAAVLLLVSVVGFAVLCGLFDRLVNP